MRFDNLESLKNPQGFFEEIQQVVTKFIGLNPILSQRAKEVSEARILGADVEEMEPCFKTSMTQLEVTFEEEFLKRDKLEFLLRGEAAENAMKVIRDNAPEEDWEMLCLVWAYMRLHKRVSQSQLLGWLAATGKFETGTKLVKFIEDYTNKMWNLEKRSGWFTTRAAISEEESFALDLFQSSLPMVVPPKKISAQNQSAYLVRKASIWTKKALKHKELPYEAVNLLNSTRYMISYPVWDKFKFHIELPEQEIGESETEFKKRKQSVVREHWRKAFVIELFHRLGIKYIWIPCQLDHRGRKYDSLGGIFNTQGKDIDKGIFAFAPEECSEIGQYWLAISIANCFNSKYKGKDLDKLTFEDRYEWYNEVVQPMMDLEPEEFNNQIDEILPEAESPVCFWAQVQNMYSIWQAIKAGRTPMVWSITHWDATSSGYQFQSMFASDEVTGEQVNLTPKNQRFDLYTILKQEVEKIYGKELPYSRKQLKQTIWIPSSYGASEWYKKLEQAGHKDLADAVIKALEQRLMWPINRKLSKLDNVCLSYDEYEMYIPDGMRVAKKFNHHSAKTVQVFGKPVKFELVEEGRGLDPKTGSRKWSTEYLTVIVHSCDAFVLRELEYRAGLTPEKVEYIRDCLQHPAAEHDENAPSVQEMEKLIALTKAFRLGSYRILHVLNHKNAYLIHENEGFLDLINEMIENCDPVEYSISTIHDSFGVSPNNVDFIMDNYRSVMADVAQSKWLTLCVQQLTRGKIIPEMKKPSKEFINNILNSKYMLC